jgi:hypothetical protein
VLGGQALALGHDPALNPHAPETHGTRDPGPADRPNQTAGAGARRAEAYLGATRSVGRLRGRLLGCLRAGQCSAAASLPSLARDGLTQALKATSVRKDRSLTEAGQLTMLRPRVAV